MMEQSRLYKQLQCNTMEPRNEEFQSGSQSVIQDHMDGMHSIRSPSDYNMSDVKPVLNYSIQTGEEFALEFMRDRVNLRKPVFSNVGDSNSNYTTGCVELKGVLGVSHAASESGSDISMLSKVDKGTTEFNRQSASLHRDRSNYGSIRTIPRSSFNQESGRFVHGYGSSVGSDSSLMTMKCLCSFGGRILPRPSDGKLRYVGGQTHILRLRKDISWQELMQKALLIYNLVHVLKYQLPGEDLDALVSVSSDEDLQNMMEEWYLLENRERSQKLRLFLFSMSDLEDAQFALSSIGDDSDVQYVVAVNGMDFGSINSSTPLGVSFSAEDLHELERQTTEREARRVAAESIGVSNAPFTNKSDSSLTIHSSQPVLPNLSNAHEIDQLSYGDQMTQVAEYSRQYFVHHGLNSTHNPMVGETPMAPHLLNNQQGVLNEDYLLSGLQIQNSQLPTMQVKKIGNGSVIQGSDPSKVLSSEAPSPAPLQPFESCQKSNFPEAVIVTMPEEHLPSLPSTKKVQNKDCEDASSTSSSAFVPAYVDSNTNAIDLSCLHPPPLPERVYYSERTPREQVELLNRSSKSDDTHSSQIHVSDLLSDVTTEDTVTKSGDNLHDGKMLTPTAELGTAAKPLQADGHTIDNGFSKNQLSKLLPNTNSLIKSKLSEHADPELKPVLPSNEGYKDVETENYGKDNYTKPLVDETETKTKDGKSDLPSLHHVSSVKHLDDLASNLPEIDWGEASGKESNDGLVQELPVSVTGNVTKDVYLDFHSVVSKQSQGDILIDIDDRFPRELLSDMFSKAILGEDPSSLHPLAGDGVGLSINMENHEPKRWSYFHKLAQGLDNVSLIDQDHLGFSPVMGKTGDNRTHHVTPLATDGVPRPHDDSHLNFSDENQDDLHRRIEAETAVLKSNYNQSQPKDEESMQFDAMMENLRTHESEFEDGKFDAKHSDLPTFDPSFGEIDNSNVQLSIVAGAAAIAARLVARAARSRDDDAGASQIQVAAVAPAGPRVFSRFVVPLSVSSSQSLPRHPPSSSRPLFISQSLPLVTHLHPLGLFLSSSSPSRHLFPLDCLPLSVSPSGEPLSGDDSSSGDNSGDPSSFVSTCAFKNFVSPMKLEAWPFAILTKFSTTTFCVIKNEDLEELRELGSGTFGTVYHGKWRGTDVAIKRIKKSCFTGRSSEQERLTVEFWREADILSKLHHPNVVAFYGVVQHGPGGTMATVAEYMVDGSLRHVLLRKDRYLDRRKRLIIAMDAAFGMEYLHSKNIVHFDLKCDNLLVNLKDPLRPICKVGDFGLSKIKRNTLVTGGVRGTLPWMAPELLNGSSNKVSEKVDVFSFGIVLWEILTGEEPYANMHYGAIIGGIVNNTLRPTIPSNCDPEWRTLMEQCWAPNPAARPSFTEIASRLRIMSAAASQTKTQGQKPSK
ncbi:hypothetical protein Fmac_025151 [Flemingia macrophylla]|uniref:Protein kinase domain-containing protein n=1 Tax=Flemingia macrophylla TaxID=520843 RepID=A0ABD1LRI1_9FABA